MVRKKITFSSLLLLMTVLIGACSFNKLFLQPYKIPADKKQVRMVDSETKDTMFIRFSDNYQPNFISTKGDTLKLPYTVESVVFNSYASKHKQANKLNAWIISPKQNYNGKLILLLHGNAGNILYQFTGMLPFVKKGFKVMVVDYSGFGYSSGKSTRNNVLKDANASLDYLVSRKDLNYDKLILYGQSLGGHLSAVVAAQNQSKIDALVIEGAFSSHKDIAARTVPVLGRLLVSEKYSAFRNIRKYNKPVLIIHSTEDETIPFKMGQKIFANANEPKLFYQIEKPHIAGPIYYSDSISAKINRMLH